MSFKRPSEDQLKLIAHQISEIESNMEPDDFQRDFFESLSSQFEQRNSLTEKQMASLEKMYERVTK